MTTARPLRRDAAANRERLLSAAADVFHASGVTASLDEVARRAGVGVATLYRNFPNREALLDALLVELLDAYVATADDAQELPDGTGLAWFVRTVGEVQATPRGCALRLWSSAAAEPSRTRLHERIEVLVVQAQRAGTCRPDVTLADVIGILVALRGVRETPATDVALDWRRHLELCLAGLRP